MRCTTVERPFDCNDRVSLEMAARPLAFFVWVAGELLEVLSDLDASQKRRARASTRPSRTRNSPAKTWARRARPRLPLIWCWPMVIGWARTRALGAWPGPEDKEHVEENVDRRPSNGSPCSRSAVIMALFQAMRLPHMMESSSCTSDLPEQEQAKIGAMPATMSLFVASTASIVRACWTEGAS